MEKINFIFIDDKDMMKNFIREIMEYDPKVIEGLNEKPKPMILQHLEHRVSKLLQELGVPANIKGYKYLRDAIMVAVTRPEVVNSITKVLYPEVAKINETVPPRVERAIRHAIEVAWSRGRTESCDKIFGYTINMAKGKPTNSEFIALIADRLRLENNVSVENKG